MSTAINEPTSPRKGWRVQFKYAGTWWNFATGITRFSDAWSALGRMPSAVAGQPVEHRIVKTFD